MERIRLTDIEAERASTRVLLVGEQWESLAPVLTVLSAQNGMVFLGPESGDVELSMAQTAPAVILVGPGYWRDGLVPPKRPASDGPAAPSVLLCITHDSVEHDDLYEEADDFLVVPCSASEMGKRIHRLARRNQPAPQNTSLAVGNISLDMATYQVMVDNKRVDLAWMEFQLLKFLMQSPGRVFTREQLLARVWGVDSVGGTRTVDVHIRRLRSKLGLSGEEHFRTVKNVGYSMVDPR